MSKFCYSCGSSISEEAKFCGNCGEPLRQGVAESTALEVKGPSQTAKPKPTQLPIQEPVQIHPTQTEQYIYHQQEYRDKTGFFNSFINSAGSEVGGCLGEFVGCLMVLALILLCFVFFIS